MTTTSPHSPPPELGTVNADGLADRLSAGAAGWPPSEAAAIIATKARGGRLLELLGPAIDDSPSRGIARIRWDDAVDHADDVISGRAERRLVRLAASLADNHPIGLCEHLEAIPDDDALVVLTALARRLGVDLADLGVTSDTG